MDEAKHRYEYLSPQLRGYVDPTVTKYMIRSNVQTDINSTRLPRPVLDYNKSNYVYTTREAWILPAKHDNLYTEFYELLLLEDLAKDQTLTPSQIFLYRDVPRTSGDKIEFTNFIVVKEDILSPTSIAVKMYIAFAACKANGIDVINFIIDEERYYDYHLIGPIVVAAWLNGISKLTFCGEEALAAWDNVARRLHKSMAPKDLVSKSLYALYDNMTASAASLDFMDAVDSGDINAARSLLAGDRLGPYLNDNTFLRQCLNKSDFLELLLQDARVDLNRAGLLSHAVKSGNTKAVEMLVKNPRVDTSDPSYIHEAVEKEHYKILDLLLHYGTATPLPRTLRRAVGWEKPLPLYLLLKDGRVDPSGNDSEIFNLVGNNPDILKLLLEDGRAMPQAGAKEHYQDALDEDWEFIIELYDEDGRVHEDAVGG